MSQANGWVPKACSPQKYTRATLAMQLSLRCRNTCPKTSLTAHKLNKYGSCMDEPMIEAGSNVAPNVATNSTANTTFHALILFFIYTLLIQTGVPGLF